jgi:hypothetical protein
MRINANPVVEKCDDKIIDTIVIAILVDLVQNVNKYAHTPGLHTNVTVSGQYNCDSIIGTIYLIISENVEESKHVTEIMNNNNKINHNNLIFQKNCDLKSVEKLAKLSSHKIF